MSAHEANPGKSRGQPAKPTQKASWRKAGAAAAGAAARGWSKTKPVSSGPSDRSVKLAVLGLLLVGLVIALFVWILFRPRALPIIAISLTQYESGLIPPNSWALEDGARLAQLEQAELVPADAATDLMSTLDRQLADAPKGGGPDNTLLVVLSAHGVVNDEREPCLLVEKSNPLDPASWLPLKKILDKLDEYSGFKHKVLVLDCQRLPANWSLGILHNDFAERLAERADGLKSVVVIASAGPGQTAQAAPELGGSAFGYYLARGLAGEADGWNDDGRHDGKVALQEAMRYLRMNVDQWAKEHREARQQPMLLPASRKNDNFALIHNATQTREFAPPTAPRAESWQTVAKLWQRRDELAKRNYVRYDPLGWGRFQRSLLRLEQLLLAGKAYEFKADQLARNLVDWAGEQESADRLAKRIAPDGVVAATIPLARQWSPPPLADELERLRDAWPKGAVLPGPEPAPPDKFSRAAATIVGWGQIGSGALADGAADDALRKLLVYVEQSPPPEGVIDFAEWQWQWLRLTARRKTPPVKNEHLRKAIDARDAGDAAAAAVGDDDTADERGQYAIAAMIAAADDARRDAEDRLLVGDNESLAKAEELWQRATTGGAAAGDYARARELAGQLAKAHAARDQALAEAPYWSAWVWQNMLSAPSRDSQGGAGRTDNSQALESLKMLLTATPRLGAAIDQVNANAGQEVKLLDELREQVSDALVKLKDDYDQAVDQLRGSGADQNKFAALEAVLAVPLLDAGRRNQRRSEYLEIIARPAATSPASHDTTGAAGQNEAAVDSRNLLPWPLQHPAVLLTDLAELTLPEDEEPRFEGPPKPAGGDDAEPTDARRHERQLVELADQSARLRKRLAQVPKQAVRLREKAAKLDAAVTVDTAGPPKSRVLRSQADRLVRAYAALIDGPWTGDDPVEQLRRADLHELMLLQARRALDDFLGPKEPKGVPCFLPVAQACWHGAEQLLPGVVPRREAVADLIERRRQAADEFVDLAPNPLDDIEGRKLANLHVTVQPAADIPAGLAAFAVELGDRPLQLRASSEASEDVLRLGVPLADANTITRDYGLPLGPWAGQAIRDRADPVVLLLYRGHERRQNVPVTPIGRMIEYQPDVFGPPRVTVKGSETQTGAVMFIFDCSGSMKTRDVSSGGDRPTMLKRIDACTSTLRRVLKNLPKNYQVGIMFYGHRRAWKDSQVEAIIDSAYEEEFRTLSKRALEPSEDVELVFNVGAFNNEQLVAVERRLTKLRPWGQTPLYLAIHQAIAELARVDSRLQKHIIVITDGFDEIGPDPNNRASKVVTLSQIRDELAESRRANQPIQLDVLGVNLTPEGAARSKYNPKDPDVAKLFDPKNAANVDKSKEKLAADRRAEELKAANAAAEASKEMPKLQVLIKDEGVRLLDAREASDILDALRESLPPLKFQVQPLGERPPPGRDSVVLGESWPIDDHPSGLRRAYRIQVLNIDQAKTDVEIVGGEALELFLERKPDRPDRPLVFSRYRPDERASEEVQLPKTLEGTNKLNAVWVAAHMPSFETSKTPGARDARFFLSVQNADATRFSPRPVEVVAEIRPLGGKSDPYVFVEGNFVAYRVDPEGKVTSDRDVPSVPVVQFLAPHWPANAQEAQIDFWCKFAPTRPDVAGRVADLMNRPPEKIPGMRVEADFGDEPQGDYRVRVQGNGLAEYKVDIDPPAKRIERHFNAQGKFVKQVFYFNGADEKRVGGYKLSFTSLASLRKDAVHPSKPLERLMQAK